MRSLEQTIAAARALGEPPVADPVGAARQRRAIAIADALEARGFPRLDAEKAELSLVPLLFQEANYDDIGWMNQRDDMRQLGRGGQVRRAAEAEKLQGVLRHDEETDADGGELLRGQQAHCERESEAPAWRRVGAPDLSRGVARARSGRIRTPASLSALVGPCVCRGGR